MPCILDKARSFKNLHSFSFPEAGEALSMPDPVECFQSLADHATMTGRKFEAGYAAAFESGSKRDKVDG